MTELNTAPQLAPHERCTGCAACCNGCLKGAIRMIPDREGFLYPQVTDGCVQCGHCDHRCPFHVDQTGRMVKISAFFGY